MDDQRIERGRERASLTLPRFGIRTLLIFSALIALWLLSARLPNDGAGDDIRKASLLLLVIATAALAIYGKGHRRAFWAGFSFSLFMIASQFTGFILNFRWLERVAGRYNPNLPAVDSSASLALYWMIRLVCILALCTIAGVITVQVYDRSRREE